jgi:hypothetical protein
MTIAKLSLVVAGLCSGIALPALAWPVDQGMFRKYLASSAHNGLVEEALNSLPPEVFTRCPAFKPGEPDILVTKPVGFAQDGTPNAGAWTESFPVKGCGNDTILHVNFVAGDSGKMNVFASLPGSTHADLILQKDALPAARLGPGSKVKDCERIFVTNTRFDAFDPLPPPPAPAPKEKDAKDKPVPPQVTGRPWHELWTVFACGRRFNVPMRFVPDATGTGIVQKSEEITELQ